ncbi:MAG: hypothetical protein ACK5WD_00190 [bacterium]|jgi:MYXO-CTERM domain-containing protein
MLSSTRVSLSVLALCGSIAASADANLLVDGGFENQAVLQNNPFTLQADGSKWGASWGGPDWGWSSWQGNFNGAWSGGAIARTEDFAAGWKWAHTGDVFGIVKDRQTMSQSFTATESGAATVSWFDANRASWREHDWFGRENNYSVTLTDSLGNVQNVGNYTSVVAGGNSYSSPAGNGWWTLAGKQGWFERFGATVTLQAGMTYTLSFNSLSPYNYDANGNITGVDDRTTFLDDISVTMGVVPSPGALAVLGFGALGARRRRR